MKTVKQITFGLMLLSIAFNAYSVPPEATASEKATFFITQGDELFSRSLYQKAQLSYQKAARYVSEPEELKAKIARTFYQLNNHAIALQIVDEVLEVKPGLSDALLLKGQLLEATNKNDLALQFYNMAEYYAPENKKIKVLMSNVLRKMDLENEASTITQQLDKQRADLQASEKAKHQIGSAKANKGKVK